MRRIMIIGGPGSGKSTLARLLGARLDLPVYYMDQIHWTPGWVERPQAERIEMVRDIIAREAWVFEGGHSMTQAARLERADLLIWLDIGVSLRIWRVVRRNLRGLGQVRVDMQEDCPERLDMLPEFLRYIWTTRHSSRMRSKSLFDGAEIPKQRFRSLSDVKDFIDRLP